MLSDIMQVYVAGTLTSADLQRLVSAGDRLAGTVSKVLARDTLAGQRQALRDAMLEWLRAVDRRPPEEEGRC